MAYTTLKAAIQAAIKNNDNEEITGNVLQGVLLSIVNSVGDGFNFAGVATPSTNPGTPDGNMFWIGGKGTYTNFGSTIQILDGYLGVFTWNGSAFSRTALKIGGSGGAFDVSDYTGNQYASLSAALAAVPADVKAGGMSIKFINSGTGKYEQWRLMATSWSNTESDWQGVDSTPSAGSVNLLESGGVSRALGDENYPWIPNKYINLSGGVGATVPAPTSSNGWGYCDVLCDEGTICVINGNGGNFGLWGFVNDDNEIISWSGTNAIYTDLRLVAPEGTARLIVNTWQYSQKKVPNVSLRYSVVGKINYIIIGTDNIEDGAVTNPKLATNSVSNEKVVDKAITTDKTNLAIIPSVIGSFDYTNSIAELYITAPIATDAFIAVKSYYNEFFIWQVNSNGYMASNYWIAKLLLSRQNNREVITLYCTTGNSTLGVSVGDVVGYIIFRNVAKIASYNDDSRGYRIIDTDWLYDISKSPTIASSFLMVPEDRLADNFIVAWSNSSNVIYDIRNCIAQFYLKEDAVIFNNDSHKYVSCKVYGNWLYIYSYNGSNNNYGFTSSNINVSTARNNQVYEIIVTTAGANGSYPVGSIVGYIVFKDVETLRTKINGQIPINVIRENVIQIRLSPMIYAYMKDKEIEEVIGNPLTYADISIPSDIYVVKDNQLMIFYKDIVKSYNQNIYGVRVVSSVGKAYPNYYLLQANTVGNYSITISIVDENDNVISSKVSTIHVINHISSPSANKNVLMIGDSVMVDGYIAGELKRRLTELTGDGTTQNPIGLGLSNISFVGRKVGSVVSVYQEATGGWSWKDYATEGQLAYRFTVSGVNQLNIGDTYTVNSVVLTIAEINVTEGSGNIRCTYSGSNTIPASGTLTRSTGSGDATIIYSSYQSESYNPFWNPNKSGGAGLDFINYANEYCNGSINVIAVCCGLNDFNRYTPATIGNLFTDYIKPFLRAYHADFPSGKVIIGTIHMPSPNGGMAANYGAASNWNWLTTASKIWAFNTNLEALVNDSEFSGYVVMADITSEFDCEHSYPTTLAYVNNRSTQQETVDTNGVHFTTVGAYQVADSLYHAFNRLSL